MDRSILIGACLVIGILVLWVVRNVSNKLRRLAAEMGEGADQVASAAFQVSCTSQSLAQGASEQAASLEETSASSEESAPWPRGIQRTAIRRQTW